MFIKQEKEKAKRFRSLVYYRTAVFSYLGENMVDIFIILGYLQYSDLMMYSATVVLKKLNMTFDSEQSVTSIDTNYCE